ncbi:MAG: cysteine hydrolase family protein [SAR324 cluster bacterium]|nr:cysteine hydrolase family protein [SAR324 cluster bacterium]
MSDRALIVIDVQMDYFPGGASALPDAERALPRILKLIAGARERGEAVLFIQHITPQGSPVFAEGSAGAVLHGDLERREGDPLFAKSHPSAFQETGLLDFLEQSGIAALDICGFMTQMCCDTTSREAYGRGYAVRLFSDATAAKALEVDGEQIPHHTVHQVSLGALARFAKIISVEEA